MIEKMLFSRLAEILATKIGFLDHFMKMQTMYLWHYHKPNLLYLLGIKKVRWIGGKESENI